MSNQIKLMNEYTMTWPLWDESGPVGRRDLPLSESLALRLESWARTFNDHFSWETGWDDPSVALPHRTEAHELHRLVAAELGSGYDVVLDLWET